MRILFVLCSLFCFLNACSGPYSGASAKSVVSTFERISYEAFINKQYKEVKLDEVPRPINGELEFLKAIYRKLNYPLDAQSNGVQGSVYVQVVMNETGELVDAEVSKGLGYGCDEEALAAIRRAFSVTEFEPAIYRDKAVKVRFEIPVKFKLV